MSADSKYRVKFVDYPLQYRNIQTEIQQVTHAVLSAGDLILRQQTEDFEARLAEFCGTRYAIGVSNCTDALFLSYKAAGLGPGDEVITVGHTFVATVASIVHTGATPVLVDIQDDHNVSSACVEASITPRTRALVPVSLNGRAAQLDVLSDIARQHDLLMIEDSAQALGATLNGKMAGSWGLAGCFSFYPAKLLGTFGDAGAIITDDADLADRLRLLRNHGRTPDGDIAGWSYNCRIDNLHAAWLDLKLRQLPDQLERRREIARIYVEELGDLQDLRLPPGPDDDSTRYDVFQNFEIEANDVNKLIQHLTEQGVETLRPWGGRGVHQFPNLGLQHHQLPRTDRLFADAVLLPMYPELTDAEIRWVTSTIRTFYGASSIKSAA